MFKKIIKSIVTFKQTLFALKFTTQNIVIFKEQRKTCKLIHNYILSIILNNYNIWQL